MDTTFTSWLTLAGLGAFHGLNPGMGWLFAVALGMQEKKRAAVWRALIPLTLGHVLAIAAAIAVAMAAGTALSPGMLRWPVALLLAGLGVRQLYRHVHPRWAAMRVRGESMSVGPIPLTRTPRSRHSSASALVNCISAPFVAV